MEQLVNGQIIQQMEMVLTHGKQQLEEVEPIVPTNMNYQLFGETTLNAIHHLQLTILKAGQL